MIVLGNEDVVGDGVGPDWWQEGIAFVALCALLDALLEHGRTKASLNEEVEILREEAEEFDGGVHRAVVGAVEENAWAPLLCNAGNQLLRLIAV